MGLLNSVGQWVNRQPLHGAGILVIIEPTDLWMGKFPGRPVAAWLPRHDQPAANGEPSGQEGHVEPDTTHGAFVGEHLHSEHRPAAGRRSQGRILNGASKRGMRSFHQIVEPMPTGKIPVVTGEMHEGIANRLKAKPSEFGCPRRADPRKPFQPRRQLDSGPRLIHGFSPSCPQPRPQLFLCRQKRLIGRYCHLVAPLILRMS